jgi:hypothetical protein
MAGLKCPAEVLTAMIDPRIRILIEDSFVWRGRGAPPNGVEVQVSKVTPIGDGELSIAFRDARGRIYIFLDTEFREAADPY